MNPWAIPAIMSIFSGFLGYQSGKEQEQLGRDEEQLAKENAVLAERELAETVRRQEAQDLRLRSATLARSAASGAEVDSGTPAAYMNYQAAEQSRQLAWTKESGASAIRLKLKGDRMRAKAAQDAGKTQQWSSLLQGTIGAFSIAGQSGYFTKPNTTSVSWTSAITGPK